MATAATRGDHKSLAPGKDSETQIKRSNEFERRNELDGGSVVEERCYTTRKRHSANQGVVTMQCNFRRSGCQNVQD